MMVMIQFERNLLWQVGSSLDKVLTTVSGIEGMPNKWKWSINNQQVLHFAYNIANNCTEYFVYNMSFLLCLSFKRFLWRLSQLIYILYVNTNTEKVLIYTKM